MLIMTTIVPWYGQDMFDDITRSCVTEQARCDYYFPLERGAAREPGVLA